MRIRRRHALLLGLLLCSRLPAADWLLSADLRLVDSDAERSFVKGGADPVRFDGADGLVQLGRLRFALDAPVGERWSAHLDVSAWDDHDKVPAGPTEAYLLFRPYPWNGYRLRLRLGEFYAPISLENRASGWESPYTLSFSAINSWLATEVRTVGLETSLEWLGTRRGHAFDLAATGGVYGWNDRIGVSLALDGFQLHDRQTPFFGRLGPARTAPLFGAQPFTEIDHRAGVYGGLEARVLDRLVLRVLRYDNRADPADYDSVSNVIAWQTRFTSAGARLESESGWTGIVQWLDGSTVIAPPPNLYLEWPFRAAFGLVSKRLGRHTLSARYDQFEVDSNIPTGAGYERGHALTAAWMFNASARWRLALEWLRVRSYSENREEAGGESFATDNQLQFSVRYTLGSMAR